MLCVSAFIITMGVVSLVVVTAAALIENPDLIQSARLNTSALSYSLWEERMMEAILDATAKYAGLASILGMLCGLPWFLLLRGKRFFTTDVTRTHSKVKISTVLIMFVFIMGAQFFMMLIQIGLEPLFNQGGDSLTDSLDESTIGLAASFWGVLYAVIVGPICEELVFRGAVMRKLEKYGANFAIIVSSLLFALYHIILFQAAFAFLIGLILAYMAGRFSLKWAVVLHMANNGLAMLSLTLGSDLFNIFLSFCYLLSFVATLIILIKGRRYLQAQKQAGAPSEPRVYARAFSSPWLISYMVLCVLGGIQIIGTI